MLFRSMTLPNTLTISGYHKLNEKFGLSASARWTKWDVFDDFVMKSDAYGTFSIPERWDNVWTYSLGLDYYYNQAWTFRTGVSLDPTPIQSDKFRTARIPDSDRFWMSLGASYQKENWQFDVGYSHLFMNNSNADNDDGISTLRRKKENYRNMMGVQIQYNF